MRPPFLLIRYASIVVLLSLPKQAGAEEADPLRGRTRLYSAPDPSSPGGIRGRIAQPSGPIGQVLAIPSDEPRLVYEGSIAGVDRRDFSFAGLPMRKYDLVIIYENQFYEGLQLLRGDDTLTQADRTKIGDSIQKSEPYFPYKKIHRLEGTTGRGEFARCICTYALEKGSDLSFTEGDGNWRREDHRRTFKLVVLKDVGPGWQIVRARDLYPEWVKPGHTKPHHRYRKQLSQIRVADRIKDIGELDLTL
jgi:hypothetical protein